MTHAWKKLLVVGGIAVATIGAAAATSVGSAGSGDGAAAAAVEMFLRIEGIEGESTDKAHAREIDVQSYTLGATRGEATTTRTRSGSVTFSDFTIVKRMDKSSPKLLEAAATGKNHTAAVLSVRRAGEAQDFLRYTLRDVTVTSYQASGASDTPTEQVSLNFGLVEVEYAATGRDGSRGEVVKASWNTKTAVKQ